MTFVEIIFKEHSELKCHTLRLDVSLRYLITSSALRHNVDRNPIRDENYAINAVMDKGPSIFRNDPVVSCGKLLHNTLQSQRRDLDLTWNFKKQSIMHYAMPIVNILGKMENGFIISSRIKGDPICDRS